MEKNSIYNPKLKWYNLPEKNEFIKILQDQGVSNFDPVKFYKESTREKNQIKFIYNQISILLSSLCVLVMI